MKYPIHQERKLSSLTLILLILSCVTLSVVAPTMTKKMVASCLYPVICLQQSILNRVQGYMHRWKSIDELEHRLHRVQEEKQALMARIIEYEATNHYMHGIEELLAFKRRYALEHAYCVPILSKTISEQSHTMLIDAGSLHGIQVDMIALYNNILLGRVTQVYPTYSKVVLISDRDCKVAVYCAATGACGIHEGCNSKTCVVSKVSHLDKVTLDDLVISSGQGSIFPQGFALGRITEYQQQDLFYTITVAPLIDYATLSYCMIISKEMIA
jgi:rod shape-determining protein MreC